MILRSARLLKAYSTDQNTEKLLLNDEAMIKKHSPTLEYMSHRMSLKQISAFPRLKRVQLRDFQCLLLGYVSEAPLARAILDQDLLARYLPLSVVSIQVIHSNKIIATSWRLELASLVVEALTNLINHRSQEANAGPLRDVCLVSVLKATNRRLKQGEEPLEGPWHARLKDGEFDEICRKCSINLHKLETEQGGQLCLHGLWQGDRESTLPKQTPTILTNPTAQF